MKVYLVYTSSYEDLLLSENARLLLNYASAGRSVLGSSIPQGFRSILIDSGVFLLQVGTRTEHELTLEGYCLWLQLNLTSHPEVDAYIAFDWDGGEGSPNVRALRVRKNYERMLAEGLSPIPVWHVTLEGMEGLRYYAEHSEYIAIGSLVSQSRVATAPALLSAVSLQFPSHRFHILGVGHTMFNNTPRELLPYSIDVSTWNVPARFGNTLERNPNGTIVERHMNPNGGGKRVPVHQLKGGRNNFFLTETLRTSIRTLMSMEDDTLPHNPTVQPVLL